jgi:hypothetical protein
MKKILLLLSVIVFVNSASAFRLEYGNNVTISEPVYEDIYIAGGVISINAPIHGDLICAGGTIIINDSVMNDILVAGGTVTFNGYVGDDIRCAGGQLYVQKNISGDLVIAGGKVLVDKNVIIGDGLLISGGDITFNGVVKNQVKAAVGSLVFNGIAEKDIEVRGGKLEMNGAVTGASVLAADQISIGRSASFNGDVRYWNKSGNVDFGSSLKNGKATYDPSLKIKSSRWYYLGGATILGLFWYIGMALLMIALIQYLFESTMKKAGDAFFNSTLRSLGFGFLFFVAVPVGAVLAFITVIGVPLGLLLLFNYVVLIILATIISSVVAANWYNNRFNYQWTYWQKVFAALGIFVVLKLIFFTPFLGWLLMILIACISFGAVLISIRWKRPAEA